MIKFIYIILKLIELGVFFVFGKKIIHSKTNKEYLLASIIPIFTYSIIEGLRFGRLIDWNVYYFRYNQLGINVEYLDYEPLFRYICYFLNLLGVSYPWFIFLQCLFFITTVFIFLKNYKDYITYAVPLILICSTGNEMFIRWFLGFSFILLSLNSLINKRYIWTFFWFICAICCHSGLIIWAVFILFFKYLNKYTLRPLYSIILLFITSFILSLSDLTFITQITSFLSPIIGESLSTGKYLDETESLLSGTWGKVGIMEHPLTFNIRLFIMYAPVVFFGKEVLLRYKYGLFFYNLLTIGAIFSPLFSLIEIFDRMVSSLIFFFCLVGGIFYYEKLNFKIKKTEKMTYLIALISLLFSIYPYFSDMLWRSTNEMMFIWNANGRNFLPYW